MLYQCKQNKQAHTISTVNSMVEGIALKRWVNKRVVNVDYSSQNMLSRSWKWEDNAETKANGESKE